MFLYSSFLSTLTNKIKKHTHILSPFGVKLELHMYELISKYKRMTLLFITAFFLIFPVFHKVRTIN